MEFCHVFAFTLSLAIESSVPTLISVFIAPPHLLATVLALWFCGRDYSHVLRSKRHVEERKLKGKNEKQKRGLHSFGIKDEKQDFFFNMSVFCNGIFLLNGL